jgi:hypothetical protein
MIRKRRRFWLSSLLLVLDNTFRNCWSCSQVSYLDILDVSPTKLNQIRDKHTSLIRNSYHKGLRYKEFKNQKYDELCFRLWPYNRWLWPYNRWLWSYNRWSSIDYGHTIDDHRLYTIDDHLLIQSMIIDWFILFLIFEWQ